MSRKTVVCALMVTAALAPACLLAAGAQHAPLRFNADSARVYTVDVPAAATPHEALRVHALDPDTTVKGFLRAHGVGEATLTSLVVEREHAAPTGVTHLRYRQQVAGLPVHGAYAKAALDRTGRLVHVIDNLAAVPGTTGLLRARISEKEALAAAVEHHYAGDVTFFEQPKVSRVAVAFGGGAFQEGFLVETWDDDNMLWHTVVGGRGQILSQELRTAFDTYSIFPDHPGNSSQVVVSGPGTGNTESPIGWVSTNTTTGNNVDAYLDRDANNSADSGSRPTSSTQDFQFTASLTQEPTVTVNQRAAVTNLFYWSNVIHDTLYRHGFTESAGNFQQNNFGQGGAGNDRLRAEAQDGSGTNNANMATPGDGSAPRMQMFLWTLTTPGRDGDLDSDIIWHEYGHGLTWRMIGNMSGPFAGAIGEGMSDVLSIYMNGNDVVGEYSTNDPFGIRSEPYTGYSRTYGDHTGSSVHFDGEIYAATMWRLLDLWENSGRTLDELMDVVVDGMNFTPSRPDYEAMRDGLIATPLSDATEECLIWEAFAEFGIGQGANGTEVCFFIFCFGTDVTESFTVPSQCQ